MMTRSTTRSIACFFFLSISGMSSRSATTPSIITRTKPALRASSSNLLCSPLRARTMGRESSAVCPQAGFAGHPPSGLLSAGGFLCRSWGSEGCRRARTAGAGNRGFQSPSLPWSAGYGLRFFGRWKWPGTGRQYSLHRAFPSGPETGAHSWTCSQRIGAALPHKSCQKRGRIYRSRTGP